MAICSEDTQKKWKNPKNHDNMSKGILTSEWHGLFMLQICGTNYSQLCSELVSGHYTVNFGDYVTCIWLHVHLFCFPRVHTSSMLYWSTRAKRPPVTTGPTCTVYNITGGSSLMTSPSPRPRGRNWRRRESEATTTPVLTALCMWTVQSYMRYKVGLGE